MEMLKNPQSTGKEVAYTVVTRGQHLGKAIRTQRYHYTSDLLEKSFTTSQGIHTKKRILPVPRITMRRLKRCESNSPNQKRVSSPGNNQSRRISTAKTETEKQDLVDNMQYPNSMRRYAIAALALLLLSVNVVAGQGATERPPNIVLLFIDDWAWNGSPVAMDDSLVNSRMPVVQMPNIQRLAREGMKFRNA